MSPVGTPGKLNMNLLNAYEKSPAASARNLLSPTKPSNTDSGISLFSSFIKAVTPAGPTTTVNDTNNVGNAVDSASTELDAIKAGAVKKSAYSDFISSKKPTPAAVLINPPVTSGTISPPVIAVPIDTNNINTTNTVAVKTTSTANKYVAPPVSGVNKVPTYLPAPGSSSSPMRVSSGKTFSSQGKIVFDQGTLRKAKEGGKVSSWFGIVITFYIILLAAAWKFNVTDILLSRGGPLEIIAKKYLGKSFVFFGPSSYSHASPWVSSSNVSWVVNQRMNQMEIDYSNVLTMDGWNILRATKNVTIDTLSVGNEWPVYVRSIAVFNVRPDKLYKLFQAESFESTQKKVDPFHQSFETLATSGNVRLIRKVCIIYCIVDNVNLLLIEYNLPI